jgi:4-aminobutyrate aminotransferase-like enzyme/Ser/Thr protein kinase RdoA (MazF antagonist)
MLLGARVRHAITEAEATRLAREIYRLEVRARSLPGEYDDNFHVTTREGRAFVLKVMHPEREPSFIDLQGKAMAHLAENAPQLPLPRLLPNPSGEPFSEMTRADGSKRLVWLLSFLEGTVLAKVRPHAFELLRDLGRFLGEMDRALQSFEHPAAHRELKWDSSRAVWIKEYLPEIPGAARRALVEKFLALYEDEVLSRLPRLRRSVIYGDANDYNVLVSDPWPQPRKIAGIIDFGDMHHGLTVSEAAVAAAYAILGKSHPLGAAAQVVAGYHCAFPLEEEELAAVFPLMAARLSVSVTNSAHRKQGMPDDAYVTVSEEPAWNALEKLAKVHPRFAHYTFRAACGMTPVPKAEKVQRWLKTNGKSAAPVFGVDLRSEASLVFDLGVGSLLVGADPAASETPALTETIFSAMKRAGVGVGVGRYNEARPLYRSPLFGSVDHPVEERRTIHLGMDLFVEPGTALRAPLDAVVEVLANNRAPQDYGPLVILRHSTSDQEEFFTLYGHLTTETLSALKVGQRISRGQEFGRVGTCEENGGWPPHVHFQIILDLLNLRADFPGVAYASEREVWTGLSPDPHFLLGIPEDRFPAPEPDFQQTLEKRRALLGANLSVSYQRPLKIVRGWMQYLYDDTGRAYLDAYNNVPLVGHSHPRVVRAAQEQLALLNTNTRYLHDNVNRYAERLTEKLPAPLGVCFFVNSGSEANELALRLARAHTGREEVIVLEHAYHGHTTTLVDLSPYKFNGPGGRGRKPWVHVAPLADDYRGIYRREDKEAGARYARDVREILERTRGEGRGVAAYIAESLPSVGGQIVFPPGYLQEVYKHVRAAGAVAIADEVQVGFGRLGTHFWGFETQGVVPDIVVLGKPIGNAFPLAAVVTTKAIAASFANGMEFFSTFGGNPVACAAGLAVLDVLDEEKLQENALRVGTHLKNRLEELQRGHALVGDVRGSGLFLGVDLVLNRTTREPAPLEASYVVNRLRECGILTGTDGPHHNVIKLRPPLPFTEKDADLFVSTLDAILAEDAAKPQH